MLESQNAKLVLNGLKGFLEKQLELRLVERGFDVTGKLKRSIEIEMQIRGNDVEFIGRFNKYGIYLEKGVKSNRIPFKAAGRRGGSNSVQSAYIEALREWVQNKGLEQDAKKALGVAFAIATVHKKKGMPVDENKKLWLTEELEASLPRMTAIIATAMQEELQFIINEFVDNTNKRLASLGLAS